MSVATHGVEALLARLGGPPASSAGAYGKEAGAVAAGRDSRPRDEITRWYLFARAASAMTAAAASTAITISILACRVMRCFPLARGPGSRMARFYRVRSPSRRFGILAYGALSFPQASTALTR